MTTWVNAFPPEEWSVRAVRCLLADERNCSFAPPWLDYMNGVLCSVSLRCGVHGGLRVLTVYANTWQFTAEELTAPVATNELAK